MGYLPPEVVTDILSRLSVRNLLCFRCVCKQWRSIIDSQDFIHFHFRKCSESKSHLTLILRKDFQLFTVELDALKDAVELPHPLMCYNNRIRILGFCNGLLCICNIAEDIVIWNPSTRKHRFVPSLPVERNSRLALSPLSNVAYGFGYDSAKDDYKLLRISQFDVDISEVKIYSLRTNEWKSIGYKPKSYCYAMRMGVLVNGSLHWAAVNLDYGSAMVLAFDIGSESFREVPLPESVNNHVKRFLLDNRYFMDLGVLDGRLCIVDSFKDMGIDVWVMREYGVKESWTKLVNLPRPERSRVIGVASPLAYSRTGGEVLFEQDTEELFWFDLINHGVKNVKLRGMPKSFEAFVFSSSLVSVNPSTRDHSRNHELGDNKNKKRDDFLSEGFKLVL
ncbi:hypothetical protein UlMin_012166 [Ulmus minor]